MPAGPARPLPPGYADRGGSFRFVRNVIGLLAGRRRPPSHGLPALAEALVSGRGEALGVVLARELIENYAALPAAGRIEFLRTLAADFGPDPERLEDAIAAYRSHPDPTTVTALHAAAEPRRQELFRRLNLAQGGTERLVRMRADLLAHLSAHRELESVDADLVHLFSSWFNTGFLELRRIDWSTSARFLEKIIRYEAVHEITSWKDLRGRIEPHDRLCYAFIHPRLPDEPIIFIEVALTDEAPAAIAPLLAEDRQPFDAERAKTAVFYSTSNCQAGLKGISFGSFLIKRVVEEIRREFPAVRTFVTLSPVPGFINWLEAERDSGSSGLLPGGDRAALRRLLIPGWHERTQDLRVLRPLLTDAVARYLLLSRDRAGRPLDPVARFHLGNGALLERINWLGNPSPKGLAESAGFMVNYLYDLSRIERNHEIYAQTGRVLASHDVRRLLTAGHGTGR
jgi:malonyl-CoA decarboxylase